MARRTVRSLANLLVATQVLTLLLAAGCKKAAKAPESPRTHEYPAQVQLPLFSFGFPSDYARLDNDNCKTHVIGYRFLVWLSSNSLALGFNTTPSCRLASGQRLQDGNQRLLVFDTRGHLKARRDLPYGADGGDELVAPGEGYRGPGETLLIRLEEASNTKSAVLLLAPDLHEVARFDHFMETISVVDRSLVFQQGFVLQGPRTYDIISGSSVTQSRSVIEDWPVGTMDRKVGSNGIAFAICTQELGSGQYRASNIIHAGAHRRCTIRVQALDGSSWEANLAQDQVAEILGVAPDGRVVGIVRAPKQPDHLVVWGRSQPEEVLPWFPAGYDSKLQTLAEGLERYQGYGVKETHSCSLVVVLCEDRSEGRLMIFDSATRAALVDRILSPSDRAALAPDGMHYATLESGELRIFALPGTNGRSPTP